jgi:antitoxin component YwqK of YwqJK toxin-antitoxin module
MTVEYNNPYSNLELENIFYDKTNKIKYIGEINGQQYNGLGVLYYKNGNVMYEGGFKNNKFNGIGIRYNKNGTLMLKGSFRDGIHYI